MRSATVWAMLLSRDFPMTDVRAQRDQQVYATFAVRDLAHWGFAATATESLACAAGDDRMNVNAIHYGTFPDCYVTTSVWRQPVGQEDKRYVVIVPEHMSCDQRAQYIIRATRRRAVSLPLWHRASCFALLPAAAYFWLVFASLVLFAILTSLGAIYLNAMDAALDAAMDHAGGGAELQQQQQDLFVLVSVVAQSATAVYVAPYALVLLPWLLGVLLWHGYHHHCSAPRAAAGEPQPSGGDGDGDGGEQQPQQQQQEQPRPTSWRWRWLHNLFLNDDAVLSHSRRWMLVCSAVFLFLLIALMVPLIAVADSVLNAARAGFTIISIILLVFISTLFVALIPDLYQAWQRMSWSSRLWEIGRMVFLSLIGTCTLPITAGLWQPRGEWLWRVMPLTLVLMITTCDACWFTWQHRGSKITFCDRTYSLVPDAVIGVLSFVPGIVFLVLVALRLDCYFHVATCVALNWWIVAVPLFALEMVTLLWLKLLSPCYIARYIWKDIQPQLLPI